jgi:hypothetical protein
MKTGKLNLADRQSWQKFQHILTSFVSDYIALVAPERTKFRFEQQSLSLTFVLIKTNSDRASVNQFTHSLEQFIAKLELIGVRQIVLDFAATNAEDTSLFQHRFEIEFISPSAIQASSKNSIKNSSKSLSRNSRVAGNGNIKRRRIPGGSVASAAKNWLTSSQLRQNFQNASKLVIRDPKGALLDLGGFGKEKFVTAINWVDTFPWESWKSSVIEAQKRRHSRNLFKALAEDFLILIALVITLLWGMNAISFASIDIAKMPDTHYDSSIGEKKYRCGFLPGVNKRNYLCLSRNMSYKQVASILGGDGQPMSTSPDYGKQGVILNWKTWNGGSLNATFAGDRLVARAYQKI